MTVFLKKHFLFDQKYGAMPYIWTIAILAISIETILTTSGWYKYVVIVSTLTFTKFYCDSYKITTLTDLKFIIQLAILVLLSTSYFGTIYYIYLAWQIGSMNISKKKFTYYSAAYVTLCLASISYSIFTSGSVSFLELVLPLVFGIGSPFMARGLKTQYLHRIQLAQNNQRLETIIRQSERGRIAKDLHDNLGQAFSLITLKTELAEKLLEKSPEKAADELKDVANASRQNLNLVREIVNNLNQKTIAEAMIAEEKNLNSVNIFMSATKEEVSENWPTKIQNVLASSIKESVTNIIRYSKASQAYFNFNETATNYELTISDNGTGIKSKRANSFGLDGMKQRLKAVDGTLVIKSGPGTKLMMTIPKGDQND